MNSIYDLVKSIDEKIILKGKLENMKIEDLFLIKNGGPDK